MREDRPPRPAQLQIELDTGTSAAGLREIQSALDAIAAPLARLTSQTRLLTREQKEAHRQATELARVLGRTLPEQTAELERSFRRAFGSTTGLKGIIRTFVSDATGMLRGLFQELIGAPAQAGGSAGLAGPVAIGAAGGGSIAIGAATPPIFSSAFPRRGASLAGINLAQILTRLGINLRGVAGLSGRTVFSGGLALGLMGHAMGGVGGALLGAGGGALAGFSVAGPIGAIIGGIAGLLGGIFGGGRGEKKEIASEIANRGFEQIRELFARYQEFRIEYADALARMNQIWSEMEARWRQIGGSVGRNSISSQRPYFDQILRAMEAIEQERQRRVGALAAFPLPEFQAGGLVGGSRMFGGGMLAILHPGEFVMSRQAVELLGRPKLESMNRGGPDGIGGGDTFHISIVAADARGFEEMLRRNEGGLVRVIRRAARDRGRSAPL